MNWFNIECYDPEAAREEALIEIIGLRLPVTGKVSWLKPRRRYAWSEFPAVLYWPPELDIAEAADELHGRPYTSVTLQSRKSVKSN